MNHGSRSWPLLRAAEDALGPIRDVRARASQSGLPARPMTISLAGLRSLEQARQTLSLGGMPTVDDRQCAVHRRTPVELDVRSIGSSARQPRSRWTLMTSLSVSIRLMTRASCETEAPGAWRVTTAVWSGLTRDRRRPGC